MPIVELVVVLFLLLLNGFFAMAELAVVSARRPRLQTMAADGVRGARAALILAADPGRFLSSVQIGITLIGIVAGAFSGATLAGHATEWLMAQGMSDGTADALGYGGVIAGITYLSLIIGELLPKQLALSNAERIACWVAAPMAVLSRVAMPLVWLLDNSTNLLLRLFGRDAVPGSAVTEEEVRTIIAEGTRAGVIETAESEMIERVLRLGDRTVRAMMTPRPDVEWLDVAAPEAETVAKLKTTPFSRLPVAQGDLSDILGVTTAKDLLDRALAGLPFDLAAVTRPVPVVPDTNDALQVLEVLKGSPVRMALVVDEYGEFEGLVTLGDMIESVLGAMSAAPGEEPDVVTRDDGSLLIDGGMPIADVKTLLRLRALPDEGDYHTLAGFLLSRFRMVPRAGDAFEWAGHHFEVIDMDGRRIDKVLITPPPKPPGESGAEEDAA